MRERGAGHYWPSPTQETLLRAAVMSGADAIEAWHALQPGFDVDHLDRAARRLVPLLSANLDRLGVDDPLAPRLGALRRDTAARNRHRFEAGRRLLTALADAGIDTLMVKGGALIAQAYHDPGLRPMSDLDVVVPTARATAALEVLSRAGWSARVRTTPGFLRMQHAVDLVEADTAARCDLHWHVYWECCGPRADDDLWAASVPLTFEGVATRSLGPADQLLHLCVHGSRRARSSPLLWIPDCLSVLGAGGIDWTRLLAQARQRRVVLRAATMLAYLARTFHAPVPGDVLAALEASPASRLERLEYRVCNRPQGVLGELPSYWCHYLRLRADGQVTSPFGFARYLQETWRLGSLGDVARGALDRAQRRVRAAVIRESH